ncbi:hypothetical protein CSK62_01890 [Salmonella enterica]|nr:hypothetical protein [Salmonella enterica]EBL7403691.1 hypothetical protein [Salmonella enterica]ECA9744485.1 hypothetical protein [Salmonella enterica subsp. enterica serovar Haduna]
MSIKILSLKIWPKYVYGIDTFLSYVDKNDFYKHMGRSPATSSIVSPPQPSVLEHVGERICLAVS